MPYRTYRPNFAALQRKYQVPTFTPEDETRRALETQKANLETRLSAAGGDEVDGRNILKKALNLDEEQGLLMSTFEILNRPRQALQGLITEGPEGAIEGLTGNLEQSPVEVLDKLGIVDQRELDGVSEFALNIAGGMAMDPLFYLGGVGGVLKKTGLIGQRKFEALTYQERLDLAGALASQQLNKAKLTGTAIEEIATKGSYITEDGVKILNDDTFQKMVAKGAAELSGPGVSAEQAAYDHIRDLFIKKLNKDADKLFIAKGMTSNNLDDLEIFYKIDDYYVQVDKLEVKGVIADALGKIKSGAHGVEPTLIMDESKNLLFSSKQGGIGERLSEDVKNRFINYLQNNKISFEGLDTPQDFIEIMEKISKTTNQKRNVIEGAVSKITKRNLDYDNIASKVSDLAARPDATKAIKSLNDKIIRLQQGKQGFNAKTFQSLSQSDLKAMQKIEAKNLKSAINDALSAKTQIKDAGVVTYTLEQSEELDAIFKDMLLEELLDSNKTGILGLVIDMPGGAQDLKLVSAEELIKSTGLKTSFAKGKSEGSMRLKMIFGEGSELNTLMNLQDKTDDFFNELLINNIEFKDALKITKEPGLIMNVINMAAASKNKVLNTPANFVKNLGRIIDSNFNASTGFNVYFKSKVLRIGGKKKEILSESMMRLEASYEYFNKHGVDNYGDLITEIGEANYVLNTSTGQMEIQNRVYESKEILDLIARQHRIGKGQVVIPSLAKGYRVENIEKTLNNALGTSGGLAVKVDIKEGKYLMARFENVDGFEDIISSMAKGEFTYAGGQTLNFGKLELSQEAKDLYRMHQQQVDEVIAVKKHAVDLLEDELGFDTIQDALKGRMGYMRHSLTKEGREYLRSQSPATENLYTSGVDTFKSRTMLGTSKEINATLKAFNIVDVDAISTDSFETVSELIKITAQKIEQKETLLAVLENSHLGEDAFFKVVDNTKESAKALGPYYKKLNGTFEQEFKNIMKSLNEESQELVTKYFADLGMGAGKGKMLAMHKSAYGVLENLERAYVDLPEAVRFYDKFMNTWKSLALITPGFHMRNFFGNHTNMYIAGMNMTDITTGYAKTVKDLTMYNNIKQRAAVDISSLSKEELEVYKRAKYFFDMGIAQSRKGTRDFEFLQDSVYQKLVKDPNKLKQFYKDTVRMNYEVAEKIDDYSRYNLYMWALEKGPQEGLKELIDSGAPQEIVENLRRANAAKTVSEALFDYQHLTSFERNVMKRLFPFYTFMKNNAIFQAKSMLSRPDKYAAIGRAYDYWNENLAGIETDQLPDYMQDRMWLPLPMRVNKNDGEAISFLKLNLTPSDFTQLVRNPFRQGVVSITAPIKLAFELGTGRDSFTGRPLQGFPGEQRRLDADVGALPFLRDERGTMALSANPVVQKILNETGLRVPLNYVSIAFDGLDYITGRTTRGDLVSQVGERLGLTGTQTVDRLELTRLYQDLEQLRNKRRLFEQEMGQPLPSLDDLKLGN